jgi:DNA-binding MarR family transcriptional regulator
MTTLDNSNITPVLGQVSFAHLKWTRHVQRLFRPFGINLKQFFTLLQLANRDFLYPAEIAEMLFCDRPTATVIIKNMEKYGWINREKDPENRKRIRVVITPEGREKYLSIPQSVYRVGQTAFDPLACFSGEEKKSLAQLLTKLNTHLDQIETTTP